MAKPQIANKDVMNAVDRNAILIETVRKENRAQKLFTNFQINPFAKTYTLTGKVNSLHDATLEAGTEDDSMKRAITHSQLPPTKKYLRPLTESQEIGWMSKPLLVDQNINDRRLFHHRQKTEIVRIKEKEWELNPKSFTVTK